MQNNNCFNICSNEHIQNVEVDVDAMVHKEIINHKHKNIISHLFPLVLFFHSDCYGVNSFATSAGEMAAQ